MNVLGGGGGDKDDNLNTFGEQSTALVQPLHKCGVKSASASEKLKLEG